jgi:RNA polymerase subunit RPABC4/transcription elongation factor Spt4
MIWPTVETLWEYAPAALGALLLALWLSGVVWVFRDMRARARDPLGRLLAALLALALPLAGLLIYLILRPRATLAEAYTRALEEEALLQSIEERPRCPGCARVTDANWLLCPTCHARLKKACPDCNSLMELNWTLCPFCGNRQIDPYQVELPAEGAAAAETAVAPDPPSLETQPEPGYIIE